MCYSCSMVNETRTIMLTTKVAELIELLKKRQSAMGLNDRLFAQRYNFSRQMWNAVKHGTKLPGLTFYQNVMRVDPELKTNIREAIEELNDSHIPIVPEGNGLYGL